MLDCTNLWASFVSRVGHARPCTQNSVMSSPGVVSLRQYHATCFASYITIGDELSVPTLSIKL